MTYGPSILKHYSLSIVNDPLLSYDDIKPGITEGDLRAIIDEKRKKLKIAFQKLLEKSPDDYIIRLLIIEYYVALGMGTIKEGTTESDYIAMKRK